MINIDHLITERLTNIGHASGYRNLTFEDIVTEDALNELIAGLVGKQRQINTEKAMNKVYSKTNEQCKKYLIDIFGGKKEDEVRRIGALLILYTQKFSKATFLGFQRYMRANKFKDTEDIINEYIELMVKEELSSIYDVLEEFNREQ